MRNRQAQSLSVLQWHRHGASGVQWEELWHLLGSGLYERGLEDRQPRSALCTGVCVRRSKIAILSVVAVQMRPYRHKSMKQLFEQ